MVHVRTIVHAFCVAAALARPTGAAAEIVTFDTGSSTTLPFGATYVESGLQVTSYSDFSSIGDPLGTNPNGNALYFHGEDQYVEMRTVDGRPFDLSSFVL